MIIISLMDHISDACTGREECDSDIFYRKQNTNRVWFYIGHVSVRTSLPGLESVRTSLPGLAFVLTSLPGLASVHTSLTGLASVRTHLTGLASVRTSFTGLASVRTSLTCLASVRTSLTGRLLTCPSFRFQVCRFVPPFIPRNWKRNL